MSAWHKVVLTMIMMVMESVSIHTRRREAPFQYFFGVACLMIDDDERCFLQRGSFKFRMRSRSVIAFYMSSHIILL